MLLRYSAEPKMILITRPGSQQSLVDECNKNRRPSIKISCIECCSLCNLWIRKLHSKPWFCLAKVMASADSTSSGDSSTTGSSDKSVWYACPSSDTSR
ncbi:uncharacterized protein J3R85_006350 [Psidium guajava]|nr:uncharacterized protein J3R85_006350 [Psidium guajava]